MNEKVQMIDPPYRYSMFNSPALEALKEISFPSVPLTAVNAYIRLFEMTTLEGTQLKGLEIRYKLPMALHRYRNNLGYLAALTHVQTDLRGNTHVEKLVIELRSGREYIVETLCNPVVCLISEPLYYQNWRPLLPELVRTVDTFQDLARDIFHQFRFTYYYDRELALKTMPAILERACSLPRSNVILEDEDEENSAYMLTECLHPDRDAQLVWPVSVPYSEPTHQHQEALDLFVHVMDLVAAKGG